MLTVLDCPLNHLRANSGRAQGAAVSIFSGLGVECISKISCSRTGPRNTHRIRAARGLPNKPHPANSTPIRQNLGKFVIWEGFTLFTAARNLPPRLVCPTCRMGSLGLLPVVARMVPYGFHRPREREPLVWRFPGAPQC